MVLVGLYALVLVGAIVASVVALRRTSLLALSCYAIDVVTIA